MLEKQGLLRRPIVPKECDHNGHLYYILLKNLETRTKLIEYLKANGVLSVFHYIPLHSSPAGRKFGKSSGSLRITNRVSETLLRLPLYYGITKKDTDKIIQLVYAFFNAK